MPVQLTIHAVCCVCACACACAWHQGHSVGETPHHKYVFCRQTSEMGNIIRFCRVVLFCSQGSYYMFDLLVPFFYSIVFWVGNVEIVLLIAWLQVQFGINSASNCMRFNRVLFAPVTSAINDKIAQAPMLLLLIHMPNWSIMFQLHRWYAIAFSMLLIVCASCQWVVGVPLL